MTPPRMTLAERRTHKRRARAKALANRCVWRKVAALPSIKHNASFVENVLCYYIEDWCMSGNDGHDSIRKCMEYCVVGDERSPVCPQTLMKIFGAITGLETQRGHNEFTQQQLCTARRQMRSFWTWYAKEGGRT